MLFSFETSRAKRVREGYKRAHHISEAAIVIYCAHKSRALCPTRGKTLLLVRQQTESPSHNTFRGPLRVSSLSLSLSFPSIAESSWQADQPGAITYKYLPWLLLLLLLFHLLHHHHHYYYDYLLLHDFFSTFPISIAFSPLLFLYGSTCDIPISFLGGISLSLCGNLNFFLYMASVIF